MTTFDLVLATRSTLHPGGEPSDFVSAYDGVLKATDGEGVETTAGWVTAQKVHAALAADHGEDLFDVCDAHSHDLHVLHILLYEPGGYGFRPAVVRRFEAVDWDLLVLDYVLLDPKWRGLKLGLLAVRKVVDLLGGGCGLVVSEVAPLRRQASKSLGVPPAWLPANRTKEAKREAVTKLRRHFRRMGFERLGRTPFYALSTSLETPTAADLLNPGLGAG